MARTHAPLTSFGAELQATLREGANRRVQITFPTKNLAIRFKQRIHALRNAMKHAKHHDWEQLYRCSIYDDPKDPCTLTIGPRDAEFRDALRQAGITNVDSTPTLTEVTISSTSPGSVDAFLLDLIDQTSVQKTLEENTDEPEPETNLDSL